MQAFLLGFIGVLVGTITVAALLLGFYKWEMKLRAKKAQDLENELKNLLQNLKHSENPAINSKYN